MGSLDNLEQEMCQMAARELSTAVKRHGALVMDSIATPDGTVHLTVHDVRDAEALLTLAVDRDAITPDLYNRITGGCASLAADGTELSGEAAILALKDCWFWDVHPVMSGRRVDWHVSVIMPTPDAFEIARSLNVLADERIQDEQ